MSSRHTTLEMAGAPERAAVRPLPKSSAVAPRELFAAVLLLVALLVVLFASNFRSDMITDDPVCVATGRIANERGFGVAHAIFSELLLRPFPLLLYALNYRLFQLDLTGYHLSNALWHLANTLLVLLLGWRFTRSRSLSLLAAAIFAAHFAHWENAIWVAAVEDIYAGFFILLALFAYDRFRTGADGRWYGVTLLAAVGALISKEIGVLLPPMLLAADLLLGGEEQPWSRRWRAAARRTWPFFTMALVFGAVLVLSDRVGRMHDDGGWVVWGRHALSHPINYLGWMIWPFGTAGEVPGAPPHSPGWKLLRLGFWVARIAVLGFVLRTLLRGTVQQRLAICWLLLAITPYGFRTAMFPRYSYLASALFTLLLIQVVHTSACYRRPVLRHAFLAGGVLFIAVNVLLHHVSPSVVAFKQYGEASRPVIAAVLERRAEIEAATEVWLIDPPTFAQPGSVAIDRTWNYIVQLVCDHVPTTRCLRSEEWQALASQPALMKEIRVYRWRKGGLATVR